MDKYNKLPTEFLRARLNLIEERLGRIPYTTTGCHRGKMVVRRYYHSDGRRKIREAGADSDSGKEWLCQMEIRDKLITLKKQLESFLIDKPDSVRIDPGKEETIYNKDFWDHIVVRAQVEDKKTGYQYRGHNMDSRAEMIVAQTLDELGLQYKYEPMLVINGEKYYPDFLVYLPEFGRCFFIEFMGRLDNDKYISRNEFKLLDYLNSGMVINKDILIFCGYESSMITADDMADDIIALIRKYCRIYAVR